MVLGKTSLQHLRLRELTVDSRFIHAKTSKGSNVTIIIIGNETLCLCVASKYYLVMNKNGILIFTLSVLVFGTISSTIPVFGLQNSSSPNMQKIVLVTRQYGSVYVQYNYVISVKVFYAYSNPQKIFEQYWGTVQGAKITINIINSQGNVVKSFSGVTGSNGYYDAGFRIPDNFVVGKYSVVVTAQKGSYSDVNNLTLFVQSMSW